MLVGQPLEDVVRSYVTSLEFTQRNLLAKAGNGSIELAKLDGFAIFADRDDGSVGRHVLADNYERDVTACFRRVVRPGMGVVDIGANVGYFALLAASLVGAPGYVCAMEPNARNARLLEASRRLNGFDWLTVAQVAAGKATGLLALHSSHSTGSTSPLTNPLANDDIVTVPALRADTLVPADRRIDVIKIDVDGGEWPAMHGCERILDRDRPVVFSEFAAGMMPGVSGVSGEDYLRWLVDRRYALGVIQPDGSVERHGGDWKSVMRAYAARNTTHVDLLVEPAEA